MDSEAGVRPDPDSEASDRPIVEVIENGTGVAISGVSEERLIEYGARLYAVLGGNELKGDELNETLRAGVPLRPKSMWIQLDRGRLVVSAWDNRRNEKGMRELVQRAVREIVG